MIYLIITRLCTVHLQLPACHPLLSACMETETFFNNGKCCFHNLTVAALQREQRDNLLHRPPAKPAQAALVQHSQRAGRQPAHR